MAAVTREVGVKGEVGRHQIIKVLVGQGEESGLYSKDNRKPLLGFIEENNNLI